MVEQSSCHDWVIAAHARVLCLAHLPILLGRKEGLRWLGTFPHSIENVAEHGSRTCIS